MKANNPPSPGQFVTSKPLKGRMLTIRYPQLSDWKQARIYINNLSQEQTFILMQGNHVTIAQEKAFIQSSLHQIKMKMGIQLFLFDGEKIVGSAGISCKRFAEKHVGVLGISVAPPYRDGGVGTWYMETLLSEAKLCVPQLTIVTLEVFANNPRAIHLYQKTGFVEYGRLPSGLTYRGNAVDSISMYRAI